MLKRQLRLPVIASLMQNRAEAIAISGAAMLQTALVVTGLPGLPCFIRHTLGIPCPGCGLTRATTALIGGDWYGSLALHAFAPLVLATIVLIGISTVLPARPRRSLIVSIETVEQRTGITLVLLAGLILYWLIRLLLFPEASAVLVGR